MRPAALHRGVITARAALSAAGPLPTGEWLARTVSELLAGGLSAPGRNPVAARAPEVRFLKPAGTAPCPH